MVRQIALVTGFFAIMLVLSRPVAAQQISEDAFWSSVAADVAAIDDLYDQVLEEDLSDADTIADSAPVAERLRLSLLAYRNRPHFADPDLEAAAAGAVNGLGVFYVNLRDFRAALADEDYDLAYTAGMQMDEGAEMIDTSLERASGAMDGSFGSVAVEAKLTELGLVGGTLITAIVSAVVFVFAKMQPTDEFGRTAEKALMELFRVSLVPFGGLLFSTVTYEMADFGESYFVASGALIFGGISFISKAWDYFHRVRPAIEAQRIAARLLDLNGSTIASIYRQYPGQEFDCAVSAQFGTSPAVAAAIRERLVKFEESMTASGEARGFAW